MSDYYTQKAIAMFSACGISPTGEQISAATFAFRQATRDQRHACAEAVQNTHGIYDMEATDRAASVAMNAIIGRYTLPQQPNL